MTEQNKKYILACSVVGVLGSMLPAVYLPIVGSMSLISGWPGKFIVLGFIIIGGVSFFYYEEAAKKFSEKYLHYSLLGLAGIILFYLLYLADRFSSAADGLEGNPFAGLMEYAVRPGIGLYLEIIVSILLIVFIQFFDKYLPLQTKLLEKLKAK